MFPVPRSQYWGIVVIRNSLPKGKKLGLKQKSWEWEVWLLLSAGPGFSFFFFFLKNSLLTHYSHKVILSINSSFHRIIRKIWPWILSYKLQKHLLEEIIGTKCHILLNDLGKLHATETPENILCVWVHT